MTAKNKFDLEKSLAQLEELVEELESGDLPLEKAMQKFEDGIKLTRGCQAALKEAEQKVEILLKSTGGEELEDFEVEEDCAAPARRRATGATSRQGRIKFNKAMTVDSTPAVTEGSGVILNNGE